MVNRNGQMEAFGLAIIVILIMLGMFFVIRFTILAPEKDVKQEFVQSQLAENMISSILNVKPESGIGKDLKDKFKECAEQSSGCGLSGCGCAETVIACQELENALNEIFTGTLEVWRRNYLFRYPNDDGCIFEVKRGECPLEKDVSSGFVIVTEGSIPRPIYFELCNE